MNCDNKHRVRFTLTSSILLLLNQRISVLDDFVHTILDDYEQCYILEEENSIARSLADCNIDYIDDEFFKTSLGIEEYLSFFGLANSMYSKSYEEDINNFLLDSNLCQYKDIPLCRLSAIVQIKTRLFISKKRNAQLLILSNNSGAIKDEELIEVAEYIRMFCLQHNMIAIITARSTPLVEVYMGEVFTL